MKFKFNEQKFIEQAKAIYGADIIDECQRLNSKAIIKKYVVDFKNHRATFEYICPEIEKALHTICENAVGNLMLKLYYINRNNGDNLSPLRIWNSRSEFKSMDSKYFSLEVEKLSKEDKQRNFFRRRDFVIYVFPDNQNIKFARYDGRNVICGTPEPLDCVLFHELVHAFHHLIGRNQSKETNALNYFYGDNELKNIWEKFEKPLTDEEFSDITGWYYDKKQSKIRFDLINSNMYEVCKYCSTYSTQQDFHQRISHKGYADLYKFCQAKNIALNDVLCKIDDIILNLDEWLQEEDE